MAIITFIGVLCAVWLFTSGAQIIQDIKSLFGVSNDSPYSNMIQWYILVLLNCAMCVGFWVGLYVYGSFWIASIVSVASELFSNYINKINQ